MKILFVTHKISREVGASEDLVTQTAVRLAAGGSPPPTWFNFCPPESDPRIRMLRESGSAVHYPKGRSVRTKILDRIQPHNRMSRSLAGLRQLLMDSAPDLVVVNQGGNSDAWAEMLLLRELGIRYFVVCHAAAEWGWTSQEHALKWRNALLGAERVCFVSRENRELTESQIGMRLPRSSIVRNPSKFKEPREVPWPDDTGTLRLACIARLDCRQKGQDLILQALSRPRWKNRALSVTFFGEGSDLWLLRSLASDLGVEDKCLFAGHVADVQAIWNQHHGFIQPSRYEGFGLSLLEACFCGRMSIVTPFPAACEFVIDGESGFIVPNAELDSVDSTLDRAWAARSQWQSMGRRAIELARQYPRDPVGDFLHLLSSPRG